MIYPDPPLVTEESETLETPIVDKSLKTPFWKNIIRDRVIAKLPENSHFELLDDEFTSTPINAENAKLSNDKKTDNSEITLLAEEKSSNEIQNIGDFDNTVAYTYEKSETSQIQPKSDLPAEINQNIPEIKPKSPIRRRSPRGRVENHKYKDFVQ